MSDITLYPSKLTGEITPPPSKSLSHRAIICAAISQGDCLINNVVLSDDVEATVSGMRAMGSKFELIKDKLFVTRCVRNEEAEINCRESGSTMRFFIPMASALGITAKFNGEGRLPERPLHDYEEVLSNKGIIIKSRGGYLPFEVKGKLTGGTFDVTGNVSSQFVSGLLMAAPMIEEDVIINLTTELQSESYVKMTIDVMNNFGVEVVTKGNRYIVDKDAKYTNTDYTIEPDYSQAAFWLAAKEFGCDIEVKGLNPDSLQGDKEIINIIAKMNENADEMIIDAKDIPDIIPIIAVLAGVREGRTVITNAERLKIKESDRLQSTAGLLSALSADFELTDDGFIINGVEEYSGGVVDSCNDHRIAMSAAIASIKCKQPLKLLNHRCVSKSYANFFEEFVRLNGKIR